MKSIINTFVLSAALTTVLLSASVFAGEIKKRDVPRAVISSFEKAYPKAKVLKYIKENRDGNTAFEIECKDGYTRRDIVYSAEGIFLEIKDRIPVEMLATPVKKMLENMYPGGEIDSVDKSVRGDRIVFEVLIKKNSKLYEVFLDQNGQIIEKKKNKIGIAEIFGKKPH